MCNFFTYYFQKLNNDPLFQTEIIKSFVTGITAFLIALFSYWIVKRKEKNKEDERLANDRKSLYYNFKFIRLSCIKQISFIDVVLNEILENERRLNEHSEAYKNTQTKEDKASLFKKFPTKASLTQIKIDYGIVPTHINKFNNEDYYKILIHKYDNPTLERIKSVQTFLIHTDLLIVAIDGLKFVQTELSNDYKVYKQNILTEFYKINKIVTNYLHENLVNAVEKKLPAIPTYVFYIDLKKKYDEVMNINSQMPLTLEIVMNYVNDVMIICNQNIAISGVAIAIQKVAEHCQEAFRSYNEIFVSQSSHKESFKSIKENFKDISENILKILEQEYPEFKAEYEKYDI
jgi:hypothetical protein